MMSPGTYLAKRRRAAGLSIDDVAAMLATTPHLAEIDRRAWLERIEADVDAISPDVQEALRTAFRFSRTVLLRLIDLRNVGATEQDILICEVCGCSALDACIDAATGETCAWARPDLCTACAPAQPQEISHAA